MGRHGAKIGNSDVAIALREAMEDFAFTQTTLAEKSGVGQSSISQILAADDGEPMSNPSLSLLQKLENALGRPLDLNRREANRMRKALEEFLKTSAGQRLGVGKKERRELIRRRFFRIDEQPDEQCWVDFIRTCRGLPSWQELTRDELAPGDHKTK